MSKKLTLEEVRNRLADMKFNGLKQLSSFIESLTDSTEEEPVPIKEDYSDMPETLFVESGNYSSKENYFKAYTESLEVGETYKRANLVVDKGLAEELLEAISDPAAYVYFRDRIINETEN